MKTMQQFRVVQRLTGVVSRYKLVRYGIRLETVKEKFEDDAMGRLILGLRAAYAEIEREQSHVRMQRGRKDRIELSQAPNGHPFPMYGYSLIDTEREVKAVCPALIDAETFEKIQEQLTMNKEDSLRNNKHPDALALLRGCHIFCGVCGRQMQVGKVPVLHAQQGMVHSDQVRNNTVFSWTC